MSYEYEESVASSHARPAARGHAATPGQSTRSALLRKPDHAVASGLVQRKARDASGSGDGEHHELDEQSKPHEPHEPHEQQASDSKKANDPKKASNATANDATANDAKPNDSKKASDAKTNDPTANHAKPNDATANGHARANDTKANDAKANGPPKANDTKPNDAKTNDTKTNDAKTNDTKPNNAKANDPKANDAKTNHTQANETKGDGAKANSTKATDTKADATANSATANNAPANELKANDAKTSDAKPNDATANDAAVPPNAAGDRAATKNESSGAPPPRTHQPLGGEINALATANRSGLAEAPRALDSHDPGAMLASVAQAPPSQAAATLTLARNAAPAAFGAQRAQAQAAIPNVPAPTGLPPKRAPSPKPATTITPGPALEDPLKPRTGGGEASIPKTLVHDAPATSPQTPTILPGGEGDSSKQGGTADATLARGAQNALAGIQAPVGQVPTRATGVPSVNLAGEADPEQIEAAHAASGDQAQGVARHAAVDAQRDFGENDILPAADPKVLTATLPAAKLAGASDAPPALDLPPEAMASADAEGAAVLHRKISAQQQRYAEGKAQHDAQIQVEHGKHRASVAQLEQDAQTRQQSARAEARGEADSARQDWRREVDHLETDFRTKSAAAHKEHSSHVRAEQQSANRKAAGHIRDAEHKADAEKHKAEGEAARKKQQAEQESGGFVGWLKSKASQLIDGIKAGINFIFENLRKAVKEIFDVAKTLAAGAIELGRKAVVGLIKAFGEVLKGLVRILHIAFPAATERLARRIDQAVQQAEQIVNTVAGALKTGVAALIDFLASTIDKLLQSSQNLYNVALTLIEAAIASYCDDLAGHQLTDTERTTVQNKLLGLEEVYTLYRQYVAASVTEAGAPGATLATVIAQKLGAKTQTAGDIRQQLEQQLLRHGFASIAEFASYISRFEQVFEESATRIALDILAKYAGKLDKESQRYQAPNTVKDLYGKLAGFRTPPKPEQCQVDENGKEVKASTVPSTQDISQGYPIFADDNLPVDKRLDKVKLAQLNETELARVLQAHIADRNRAVIEARGQLEGKHELIYKMDKLMPTFYAEMNIRPGSIHDQIIQNKMKDDAIAKLVVGILLTIVGIALTVVSLGTATPGIIAAGAAIGAAGISAYSIYDAHKEYTTENVIAGAGFADEPSVIWLALAIVGAGVDMAAAVKAVRALAPAAKALEAGGEITDFTKAVKALQKSKELDEKIAAATNKAAAARKNYAAAKDELAATLAPGKLHSFPGPFTDPEVYRALAKMAVAKIKEGGHSLAAFIDELKQARIAAKLSEMTPEELVKVKQAWEGAEILVSQVKDARLTDKLPELVELGAQLKGNDLRQLFEMGMFRMDPALSAALTGGRGAAVRGLSPLADMPLADMPTLLGSRGFARVAIERGMEIWTHVDGSVVRIKTAAGAAGGSPVPHFVKEILKPGKTDWSQTGNIFAKVADNGNIIPKTPKMAADQLKQFFRAIVGRDPNDAELDLLMSVWGKSGHIPLEP